MRNLLLLFLSFFILSCGDSDEMSPVGEMLQGRHELRKFDVSNESGFRTRGSYFLFSGSMSGESYSETMVTFSFQLPDSSYAMGELSFQDIRVVTDSTIERPYVEFNWNAGDDITNMPWIMSVNVNYMVVHCKEEDFPYEVNIKEL